MNLPPEPTKRGTFEVVTATNDHTLVVKMRGEFDIAAVDTLRATLSSFAPNGHRAALVDLGELTFCDVAGVRELVRLHHMLRNQIGAVTFRNATLRVRRVIDLTRADNVLTLDAPNPSD
jgi:anti-anti-sigma factor